MVSQDRLPEVVDRLREALARGRLGKLPMFDNWASRWGMNEAALAEQVLSQAVPAEPGRAGQGLA